MKKKIIFLIIALLLITGSILSLVYVPKVIANAETSQGTITEETPKPIEPQEPPKEYAQVSFYITTPDGIEEQYGIRYVDFDSYLDLEDIPIYEGNLRPKIYTKPPIGSNLVLGGDYTSTWEFYGWVVNDRVYEFYQLKNVLIKADTSITEAWIYHIGSAGTGGTIKSS